MWYSIEGETKKVFLIWGQFHQHFTSSLYKRRSQKRTKLSQAVSLLYVFLGSIWVKALSKHVGEIDPWLFFSNFFFYKGCRHTVVTTNIWWCCNLSLLPYILTYKLTHVKADPQTINLKSVQNGWSAYKPTLWGKALFFIFFLWQRLF